MSLNGTVWAPIGPSPIDQGAINANGQVTAIAINPNNPNIIYIGTAWGGVWLSRDGGVTWTPLFDRAPSLGIGDPGALATLPIPPPARAAATAGVEALRIVVGERDPRRAPGQRHRHDSGRGRADLEDGRGR